MTSLYMNRRAAKARIAYENKWNRLPKTARERLECPDTIVKQDRYIRLFFCDLLSRQVRSVSIGFYAEGTKTVCEICTENARWLGDFLVVPLAMSKS